MPPGRVVVMHLDPTTAAGELATVFDARSHRFVFDMVTVGRDELVELDEMVCGVILIGLEGSSDLEAARLWREEAATLEWLLASFFAEVPLIALEGAMGWLSAALGIDLVASGEKRPPRVDPIQLQPLRRTAQGVADDVFAGWPDGANVVNSSDMRSPLIPDAMRPLLVDESDHPVAWGSLDGGVYVTAFHPGIDLLAETPIPDQSGSTMGSGTTKSSVRFTRAAGVSLVTRWLDTVAGPMASRATDRAGLPTAPTDT